MKSKVFLRLLVAALVVQMVPMALAEGMVYTTGDVNLREGPGLSYSILATVEKDASLNYCDEVSTDNRGVDWYSVAYYNGEDWIQGWASSKYCELDLYDPEGDWQNFVPNTDYDSERAKDYKELIDWYGKPILEAGRALGLSRAFILQHELSTLYYNDAVRVRGNKIVSSYDLVGQGFTLYGVCPGMDVETARRKFMEAGLEDCSIEQELAFDHCVDETSFVDFETDSDYMVCAPYNEDGIVLEVWFDTYTG